MCPKSVQINEELFRMAKKLAEPVPHELAGIVIAMCEQMPPDEWRRTMLRLYRPRAAKIIRT